MVNNQRYRWDFIGLSTDTKPTKATSNKVTNGSTYYESDTSKLYVWYDDQWYERKPLGGGGGGGTTDFEELSNRPKYKGVVMTGSTDIPEVETYSDFVGTDGTTAGTAGLVPAPATTDADKFLKSDGTWSDAGGGGSSYNVYSTKTVSNSNRGGAVYMGNLNASQIQFEDPSASGTVKRYFHALPYSNTIAPGDKSVVIGAEATSANRISYIGIGFSATCEDNGVVNIGGSYGRGVNSVIIGYGATGYTNGYSSVIIGDSAGDANHGGTGSISLGAYSQATRQGEMNIGSINASYGFNNTNYRLISGVHDGSDNHDAATVAQGNKLMTAAPTSSDAGVLGQLWTDTTNMHTYQCTAISGSTYTWTQRW